MRILLADQDDGFRESLRTSLVVQGHVVISAMTEFGSRLALTANPGPDFVLVDGELPGSEHAGFDLVMDCALMRIPCLLLTWREETAEETTRLGGRARMRPVSVGDILAAMGE